VQYKRGELFTALVTLFQSLLREQRGFLAIRGRRRRDGETLFGTGKSEGLLNEVLGMRLQAALEPLKRSYLAIEKKPRGLGGGLRSFS